MTTLRWDDAAQPGRIVPLGGPVGGVLDGPVGVPLGDVVDGPVEGVVGEPLGPTGCAQMRIRVS